MDRTSANVQNTANGQQYEGVLCDDFQVCVKKEDIDPLALDTDMKREPVEDINEHNIRFTVPYDIDIMYEPDGNVEFERANSGTAAGTSSQRTEVTNGKDKINLKGVNKKCPAKKLIVSKDIHDKEKKRTHRKLTKDHVENDSENNMVQEKIQCEKQVFECDICLKKFRYNSRLVSHKRIHTGEKPFECGICFKKFKDLIYLRIHARTHTGEKPYRCDICTKQFSQLTTLKMHKRIHTGEKPYACDICPKKFSVLSNLKSHKKVHKDKDLTPFECR